MPPRKSGQNRQTREFLKSGFDDLWTPIDESNAVLDVTTTTSAGPGPIGFDLYMLPQGAGWTKVSEHTTGADGTLQVPVVRDSSIEIWNVLATIDGEVRAGYASAG